MWIRDINNHLVNTNKASEIYILMYDHKSVVEIRSKNLYYRLYEGTEEECKQYIDRLQIVLNDGLEVDFVLNSEDMIGG